MQKKSYVVTCIVCVNLVRLTIKQKVMKKNQPNLKHCEKKTTFTSSIEKNVKKEINFNLRPKVSDCNQL